MEDVEKVAFRAVQRELRERRPDAMDSIYLLMKHHGFAFVHRHVERAKEVQAAGGLFRADGKRRTLGGVFFWLVKAELGPEAYRAAVGTTWDRHKARRARWAEKKAADEQGGAAAAS